MKRIILVYGSIASVVLLALFGVTMAIGLHSMVVGYLSMLIALSFVFVGTKKYRDVERGGVIGFGAAFGVGIGIALVASLFYVLGWEAYLYATDYTFMPEYIASEVDAKRAAGASAAELAAFRAEMQGYVDSYENPVLRMLMTLSEIAPVGLLVALVSAALLRNRRFMAARTAAA